MKRLDSILDALKRWSGPFLSIMMCGSLTRCFGQPPRQHNHKKKSIWNHMIVKDHVTVLYHCQRLWVLSRLFPVYPSSKKLVVDFIKHIRIETSNWLETVGWSSRPAYFSLGQLPWRGTSFLLPLRFSPSSFFSPEIYPLGASEVGFRFKPNAFQVTFFKSHSFSIHGELCFHREFPPLSPFFLQFCWIDASPRELRFLALRKERNRSG